MLIYFIPGGHNCFLDVHTWSCLKQDYRIPIWTALCISAMLKKHIISLELFAKTTATSCCKVLLQSKGGVRRGWLMLALTHSLEVNNICPRFLFLKSCINYVSQALVHLSSQFSSMWLDIYGRIVVYVIPTGRDPGSLLQLGQLWFTTTERKTWRSW